MATFTITFSPGKRSKGRLTRGENLSHLTSEIWSGAARAFDVKAPQRVSVKDLGKKASKIIKDETLNNLYGRRAPWGKWEPPSEDRIQRRRYMRAWTGESRVPTTDSSPYTRASETAVRNGEVNISNNRIDVAFSTRVLYSDMLNRGVPGGKRRAEDEALTEIGASAMWGILLPPKTRVPKYTLKKKKLMIPSDSTTDAHAFIVGQGETRRNDGKFSNSFPVKFVDQSTPSLHSLTPRPFIFVSKKMIKRLTKLYATGRTDIRV